MVGRVLNLKYILTEDQLGCQIAQLWQTNNMLRQHKRDDWEEIRKYIFQTNTSQTTNASLPWKNKTTIPKMCQIRDNLNANYLTSIFPKRKSLYWEADSKDSSSKDKRDSIVNYMTWVMGQDRFKQEVEKLILDYIDYGNAFGTVEWVDDRKEVLMSGTTLTTKVGYCGPMLKRISPLDIVFNPTAPTFIEAPKVVRSLLSMGEIKKLLESMSTDENRKAYEDLFAYLRDIRITVRNSASELQVQDSYYQMDGFTSFRSYMESDYVEVLTFYGDVYDWASEELLQNHVIMVVDRHKVISKKPNPSYFGFPPIFHVGWRRRQDNLWAMGPLDNLVGLQYRIDHVENLKADVFDLLTFPPLKIKGYVEDFNWGPMERIYIGDEGDVEMLAPPFQILQANIEIKTLADTMEEMAGSPKEAMGFRTPGEKTAYEVQRLENAAARIFQNKIVQFEEQLVERLLNAMLELARRNMSDAMTISIFDDEYHIQAFETLTAEDITGAGRIKPIAARHFAEQAEMVQNLNNFFSSPVGQDPSVVVHFTGLGIAKVFEDLMNIKDFQLVTPYIRIAEQADAQRLAQVAQEQLQMEQQTPSGLTPDDHDHNVAPVPQPTPSEVAPPEGGKGKPPAAGGLPPGVGGV